MAKESMKQREYKREKLVAKYKDNRKQIKAIIANPNSTVKQRMEAQVKLQKLPRDSASVRLRNRCSETGRSHGYFRRFGLSRNMLRHNAMWGNVPGIMKSSW